MKWKWKRCTRWIDWSFCCLIFLYGHATTSITCTLYNQLLAPSHSIAYCIRGRCMGQTLYFSNKEYHHHWLPNRKKGWKDNTRVKLKTDRRVALTASSGYNETISERKKVAIRDREQLMMRMQSRKNESAELFHLFVRCIVTKPRRLNVDLFVVNLTPVLFFYFVLIL